MWIARILVLHDYLLIFRDLGKDYPNSDYKDFFIIFTGIIRNIGRF